MFYGKIQREFEKQGTPLHERGPTDMHEVYFEKQGSVLTVKPEGRLDSVTSPVLEGELKKHLDGVQEVIMDFTGVNYISSGGLRLLLTTGQQMQGRGGNIKVIHVNENIYDVFELVGLTDAVAVEKD